MFFSAASSSDNSLHLYFFSSTINSQNIYAIFSAQWDYRPPKISRQKYLTSAVGFLVENLSSICRAHQNTPRFFRPLGHDCAILVDLLLPTIQQIRDGKSEQPIVQGSPLLPSTSHAPRDWLLSASQSLHSYDMATFKYTCSTLSPLIRKQIR